MLALRTSGTITDIKNKITSPSFQNAKIGDHIEFSMPIKRTDGNDPYTTCINCRTHGISKLSFQELTDILDNIGISDNSDRR